MAIVHVPSDFPTIADAMNNVIAGDTIVLDAGYSDETATVTVDNLIVDGAASSTDIVLQLGGGVTTLTLQGNAPIDVVDNTGNNTITGNNGDNVFTETGGVDILDGGAGSDTLAADFGSSLVGLNLSATNGSVDGSQGAMGNVLLGHLINFDNIDRFDITTGDGDDVITLGDGDDIVKVSGGIDIITLGGGTDRLVVDYSSHTDAITSNSLIGSLPVGFSGGYTDQALILGDNVSFSGIESFDITSGSGNDDIVTGDGDDVIHTNAGADTLTAADGNDLLDGGAGADTIDGGLGNDTVSYAASSAGVTVTVNGSASGGDAQGDTLSNIENLIGSGLADTLVGDGADNRLNGGGGLDTLRGMAGNNTLDGGSGNGDIADYSTASAVVVDLGIGAASNNGFGGTDTLTGIESVIGSASNDSLVGFYDGSACTLSGGAGNEIYVINGAVQQIVENANEGTDQILSFSDYTMPANVEVLFVVGDGLTGTGSGGADVIGSLGGGANTLQGLGGDDLYYVNNVGDAVIEQAAGGQDQIVTTVDYTIPDQVEVLLLSGSGLTGTGSSGQDSIGDIGPGPNTMIGLGGDDLYYVSNSNDVVQEAANGGFDQVVANTDFALPANVEALIMSGDGLTGVGTSGNDRLVSVNGANTLVGQDGDDNYFFYNRGGTAQESANGGNDTVYASVDFTLSANLEALGMNGSGLTGVGTSADEILFSINGTGNTLTGGGGNDDFACFAGQTGGTTITDFNGNGSGAGDELKFYGFGLDATLTQVDSTHWQVNYGADLATHEVITFSNGAAINPNDAFFLS